MKSGMATPLVIVIIVILIALAIGGFLIIQRQPSQQPTKPQDKSMKVESPLVGIWKPVKSYYYDVAYSQWFELKPTAEEKAKAEKQYIRFTDNGRMCLGELIESEFRCTEEEENYRISGNILENDSVAKIATPTRMKWAIEGNNLELITEWSPAGEWVPSVKLTLTK